MLFPMKNTMPLLLAPFLALSTAACGPSLATMHDRARVGSPQEGAPLHAKQAILIEAPPSVVWAVLTDFARWPEWQPSVRSVQAPRSVAPGETFRWVNGKSEIASTLALVEPNQRLAWTGSVSTAKAIHIWRLTAAEPGVTRLEAEETMDGFLLTWFYGQKDLDADMQRSLGELQRAAEARARM